MIALQFGQEAQASQIDPQHGNLILGTGMADPQHGSITAQCHHHVERLRPRGGREFLLRKNFNAGSRKAGMDERVNLTGDGFGIGDHRVEYQCDVLWGGVGGLVAHRME